MKCPSSTRRESTVVDETEKPNSALEGRGRGKGEEVILEHSFKRRASTDC